MPGWRLAGLSRHESPICPALGGGDDVGRERRSSTWIVEPQPRAIRFSSGSSGGPSSRPATIALVAGRASGRGPLAESLADPRNRTRGEAAAARALDPAKTPAPLPEPQPAIGPESSCACSAAPPPSRRSSAPALEGRCPQRDAPGDPGLSGLTYWFTHAPSAARSSTAAPLSAAPSSTCAPGKREELHPEPSGAGRRSPTTSSRRPRSTAESGPPTTASARAAPPTRASPYDDAAERFRTALALGIDDERQRAAVELELAPR